MSSYIPDDVPYDLNTSPYSYNALHDSWGKKLIPSVKRRLLQKDGIIIIHRRRMLFLIVSKQMYLSSSSIWSGKIEESTATFRCWSFCTAILTICESFQWNLYTQIIKQKVFPPATSLQNHFLFPFQLHVTGSLTCLSFQGWRLKKDWIRCHEIR